MYFVNNFCFTKNKEKDGLTLSFLREKVAMITFFFFFFAVIFTPFNSAFFNQKKEKMS